MDEAQVTARLRALREETLLQIRDLGFSRDDIVHASQDSNVDDEHDPEGATIAYERSMLQALLAQARVRLAEIDLACDRVAAGDYELCVVCGAAIGEARLEARPTASRCLRHA